MGIPCRWSRVAEATLAELGSCSAFKVSGMTSNGNERFARVEGMELGDWTATCDAAQSYRRRDVLAVQ